MKKIIIKVMGLAMFSALTGPAFASFASCSAHNKITGQFFSASGKGATQDAATQKAQDKAIVICKQASNNSPAACELGDCQSM